VSALGRPRGEHLRSQHERNPTCLLEFKGLNSQYGDLPILFDVSLRVERNDVVALLGRNGAGKSTTLKSLMGVVTPRAGSALLDGVEIAGMMSHAIAQVGMQFSGAISAYEGLPTPPRGSRCGIETRSAMSLSTQTVARLVCDTSSQWAHEGGSLHIFPLRAQRCRVERQRGANAGGRNFAAPIGSWAGEWSLKPVLRRLRKSSSN
jgi:energy-coupling factor transporter ATP-binding protein EcfA2